MTQTKHRIIVTVTGAQSQRAAVQLVLYAFAGRAPDGCKFHAITDAQDWRNLRRRKLRYLRRHASTRGW